MQLGLILLLIDLTCIVHAAVLKRRCEKTRIFD